MSDSESQERKPRGVVIQAPKVRPVRLSQAERNAPPRTTKTVAMEELE